MRKILVLLLLLICVSPLYAVEVNEDSTAVLTITFKDEMGVLATPSHAYYRIDDVPTKTQIRDWTDITPIASSVDVEITALENAILKQTHQYEIRLVSVKFTYAVDKQGTGDFIYNLVNLDRIP
jgi:hypothetical protein